MHEMLKISKLQIIQVYKYFFKQSIQLIFSRIHYKEANHSKTSRYV